MTKQISGSVSEDMFDTIKDYADYYGLPKNAVLIIALKEFFDKEGFVRVLPIPHNEE